ncbi:hypothetical protein D1BOALGB6SA_9697 [Olavius sp. associated proteobacterium Delta 1]|nr:hypothetical protein D1BOALGB6SA_9697 [Olavius sp. associated proteobacterium Delta 1]
MVKGAKCCKGIFTYIYGDCNEGGVIIGIGFLLSLRIIKLQFVINRY